MSEKDYNAVKKSKFCTSGFKLLMYRGKKKHFWFYKYCSTYTLKFFTTDIWDSPLLFTSAWHLRFHHNTNHFLRESRSDGPMITWVKSLQLIIRSVWALFAEEIAGNVVIKRRSGVGMSVVCRWIYEDIVCKEQWWISKCG